MTRNCDCYQAQLLEHLYGLLEAEDSLALIEHAGRCDDCRQSLQKADSQRRLIGAAARTEFSNVQFQAPKADEPVRVLKIAEPRRERSEPAQLTWKAWAAAAAILLVIGGVVLPTGRYVNSFVNARRGVDFAQNRIDKVRQDDRQLKKDYEAARQKAKLEFENTQTEIAKLEAAQKQELVAIGERLKKLDLYVVVTGPENLRPGEPAQYRIETKNLDNKPEPAKLTARIREQTTNRVIYEESNVVTKGAYVLNLTPDVTMKGGSHLALEVVATGDEGAKGELKEQLTLIRSAYVTQLITDKPMYQPGETLRYRSLTLDRYTFKPAQEDLMLVFTLLNPQGQQAFQQVLSTRLIKEGKEVLGPDQKPVRGIAAGEFMIPDHWAGGEYTLTVQDNARRFPPEKRKFVLNRYQKPRLNKELKTFDKKSYGVGEEVTAFLEVTRAEGGLPLAGMPVIANVNIDGKPYRADGTLANNAADGQIKSGTDAFGKVIIKFKLPQDIEKGDASLSVTFTDGSSFEPLVKPIPIVVKKLQVFFFPEGGDLIAGVPNRVYVQVRTPLDKAADLKGKIVDPTGKEVAKIETLTDKEPGISQGMGLFTFTPTAGTEYELKIETPVGIEGKFSLPTVKADGVALQVPNGVSKDPEAIRVVINSATERELLIGAYCRGRLLDYQQVKAKANDATNVALKPAEGIGGVYRVTVFERIKVGNREQLKPLAERLVYREPARKLNLAIRSDKREYLPGEKVTLTITGSTEATQAAPSIVLVGVVDKSVVKMADEKTARAMPTHFLLTSEVNRPEDLEHADILLTDHPKAPQALDLLLGTQGWRRFIESDPKRFEEDQKGKTGTPEHQRIREDVDRLMIASGRMQLAPAEQKKARNSIQLQHDQVVSRFQPQFERLETRLNNAENTIADLEEGGPFLAKAIDNQQQGLDAQNNYKAAVAVLVDYDSFNQKLRSVALLVFGVVLLLAGVGSLVLAANRALRKTMPYYVAVVGSVAVCGLVLLSSFLLKSNLPTDSRREVAENRKNNQEMPAEVALADRAEDMDRAADPRQARPQNGAGPGRGERLAGGGFGGNRPMDERGRPNGLWQQGQGQDDKAKFRDGHAVPGMAAPVPNAPPAARQQPGGPLAGAFAPKPVAEAAPKADAKDALNALRERGAVEGRADRNGGRMLEELAKEKKQAAIAAFGRPVGQDAQKRMKDLEMANREAEQAGLARRGLQAQALEKFEEQRKAGVAGDGKLAANLQLYKAEATGAGKGFIVPTMIREFAHQHRTGEDPYLRSDFTETVYWHPALVMSDGKVEATFELCDSITTFQVVAVGHTTDGRLGQVSSEFESKKPFTLDPKVPLEATANDVIDIPVAVRNASNEARVIRVNIDLVGLVLLSPSESEQQLMLQPQQGKRVFFRVKPAIKEGTVWFGVRGQTHPFGEDAVRQAIKVVPEGFPITEQASDVLERIAHIDVELPRQWVPQTLSAELTLYPSALADLQKGLEGLLREPHGCFEQTSTSNYPNVMILDYLKQTGQAKPELEQRVRDLMSKGYGRLVSFECQTAGGPVSKQGYEWFGGRAPAHEALTAYGLLQFMDMAKLGHPVDQDMVKRTREYLLSQKDGEGGFKRNARALDSFGRAPNHITNAYIVWSITESDKDSAPGEKVDLTKEIEALTKQAESSKDPYFIALVANCLLNRSMDATAYLKKLTELQKQPEGFLPGAEASITRSGGRDLLIESTALGVLAWLKANQPLTYHKNVQSAVKWIGQQRGGHGSFGSTQSTILALKALLTFARSNKAGPQELGDLVVKVKDEVVAKGQFNPAATEPITLKIADAERILKAGKNEVTVELSGKSVVPYTLAWSYQALTPKSADACPIRLSTKVDRANAKDGETVHLQLTVENKTKQGHGMVVAIVGLPAGLELPPDFAQLKDYARLKNNGTEAGEISFFEVQGTRELVIYWRDMAPNKKVDLHLDLICKVPGEFRGPASRAYLYYNADTKHWIEPVAMTITPNE